MAGTNLCLGIQRFSTPSAANGADGESLWRLRCYHNMAGKPLIDMDASQEVLLAIRDFVNRALQVLETDGGRRTLTEAERADGIVEVRPGESFDDAADRSRGVRS